MNTEELGAWLQSHIPDISHVQYVLNWGGFVNHSFTLEGDGRRYHLKITSDADNITKFRRWFGLHGLLERNYRAPKVIQWMDFPEIGFAGLLQEHVDGHIANFCESPALVRQLIELVGRLHRDADLATHLNAFASGKTYFDHFVETYMGRFNADLDVIARGHIPFVSATRVEWMRTETNRMQDFANSVQAFHRPAVEPVHGDLNEGNVLVTPTDWFVLDWDDLAIGDPAIDFAVLVWPMVYEGKNWREFSIPNMDAACAARIEVCLRAQLLDEVIDPLADYVEAHAVPSKQQEVQRVKRERHEDALQKYRMAW